MTRATRRTVPVLISLLMCGALSGCIITGDEPSPAEQRVARVGSGQLTPEQIQAELMSFADTYSALISQGADELSLEDDTLETRRLAANWRANAVAAALQIATSRNALTGLLDMTVMVTLQRQIWEEFWKPVHFDGRMGDGISEKMQQLEREIWAINDRVLDQEQQQALRELIVVIRERFPHQIYMSHVRASEFAKERQQSVVNIQGGQSLLGLFGVDPMANLSPATRQIAESRLLGERAFFFASRFPALLDYRTDAVLLDMVSEPEIQRVIASAERASNAAERAAMTIEELRAMLPAEREALIDQAADRLRSEREAALEQFFAGVEAERETILDRLESDQMELRATLSELRGAVEAAGILSESMQTTLAEANRLTASFERLKNPDARPFDITEFERTAVTATDGIRELQRTLEQANQMVATLSSQEQAASFRVAIDEGTAGVNALVDRMFQRGLLLIGALLGGLLVVLLLYRVIAIRVLVPKAG